MHSFFTYIGVVVSVLAAVDFCIHIFQWLRNKYRPFTISLSGVSCPKKGESIRLSIESQTSYPQLGRKCFLIGVSGTEIQKYELTPSFNLYQHQIHMFEVSPLFTTSAKTVVGVRDYEKFRWSFIVVIDKSKKVVYRNRKIGRRIIKLLHLHHVDGHSVMDTYHITSKLTVIERLKSLILPRRVLLWMASRNSYER